VKMGHPIKGIFGENGHPFRGLLGLLVKMGHPIRGSSKKIL